MALTIARRSRCSYRAVYERGSRGQIVKLSFRRQRRRRLSFSLDDVGSPRSSDSCRGRDDDDDDDDVNVESWGFPSPPLPPIPQRNSAMQLIYRFVVVVVCR